MPRKAVRARIKLSIAHTLITKDHRYRIRRPRNLPRKQIRDQTSLNRMRRRIEPRQQRKIISTNKIQRPNRKPSRRINKMLKNMTHTVENAFRDKRIDPRQIMGQPQRDPVRAKGLQRKHIARRVKRLPPGKSQPLRKSLSRQPNGIVLVDKQRLEQRTSRLTGKQLHLVERHVLMRRLIGLRLLQSMQEHRYRLSGRYPPTQR